jgi:spermidine/putrescine-binding protein
MRSTYRATGLIVTVLTLIAALVIGCGGDDSSSSAEEKPTSLEVLAWEGYTEPEWVEPFEKAHDVEVNVSYVGSDDELFAKVNGGDGTTFDVVATNRANLGPLQQAGVVVPLDESRLTEYGNVYPQLADAGVRIDGELLAAPFLWGSIPLMYSKKDFPQPPDSWAAVFEPPSEVCGKVLLNEDASSTISTAALYLGYDDPYKLTDEQLSSIKDLLAKTRSCARAFYTGFGDAANYFASGDVVVGNSLGSIITKLAGEKGATIAEVVPKEGALGWLDTWAITKGGEQKLDLAYEWINWMQTPEVQAKASKHTTFAPTVEGVEGKLDPELRRTLHLDDPTYLETLVPMQSPREPDTLQKRLDLWNLVKAG